MARAWYPVPAFKITGGSLLFGVGFEMMRAKRSATRGTREEAEEAEAKDGVHEAFGWKV